MKEQTAPIRVDVPGDDAYVWGGVMEALGRMAGETPTHHAQHLKDLIVQIIHEQSEGTGAYVALYDRNQILTAALNGLLTVVAGDASSDATAPPRWRLALARARLALAPIPRPR